MIKFGVDNLKEAMELGMVQQRPAGKDRSHRLRRRQRRSKDRHRTLYKADQFGFREGLFPVSSN